MDAEKVKVHTESAQILEIVVSSKKTDAIWIILGEGIHNAKCKLTPTRNSLAYAGSVLGREIIYEQSVELVQADIAQEGIGDMHTRFCRKSAPPQKSRAPLWQHLTGL
jgi:hypothetical protein